MRRPALCLLALAALTLPAQADTVGVALEQARLAFEAAAPALRGNDLGVDTIAYGNALRLREFRSDYWGGTVSVGVDVAPSDAGSCGRYAAYVRIPPQAGIVPLTICPQFSRDGADALRRLTILHEMVHVVAGPDECRAMAFAARVEQLAFGSFTPVERYWQANGCQGSAFSLP